MNDLRKGLNETLEALLITLSEENIKLIEEYISMLFKWRTRHNIVSTKDPEYFLKRDFFDSLSMIKHLPNGAMLDVGSGGGIPGLIIGLIKKETLITLIDRREKATRFLEHVKLKLELKNIKVICGDIRLYNDDNNFEAILIKNFSNKEISKLVFADKIKYLTELAANKIKSNAPIYMLTGSNALELKGNLIETKTNIKNIEITKIMTPFFKTNRYLLKISV